MNNTDKILLLDNYDSFTFNLLHMIRELGSDAEVFRNDRITLDEVDRFDKIFLSPGPGIPEEAGILLPLIGRYAATKKIFGVCLGQQAIGQAFGAQLTNLEQVHHGVQTVVRCVAEDVILAGLPPEIEVGRYHSWVVDRTSLPDCLRVLAEDENGQVMALRHRKFPVWGVQFHPESVLTPQGTEIIRNFLAQ